MRYLIASFTHKNTNIVTREKLSFADTELRKKLYDGLLSIESVHEALRTGIRKGQTYQH